MPDNPVDNEQYCYPWSPEELIEDDKYKSVSVSQLYMYECMYVHVSNFIRGGWCYTKFGGAPENHSWGWCVPGCDGELDRKTLEEDRSVQVKCVWHRGIISISFEDMNVCDITLS